MKNDDQGPWRPPAWWVLFGLACALAIVVLAVLAATILIQVHQGCLPRALHPDQHCSTIFDDTTTG